MQLQLQLGEARIPRLPTPSSTDTRPLFPLPFRPIVYLLPFLPFSVPLGLSLTTILLPFFA